MSHRFPTGVVRIDKARRYVHRSDMALTPRTAFTGVLGFPAPLLCLRRTRGGDRERSSESTSMPYNVTEVLAIEALQGLSAVPSEKPISTHKFPGFDRSFRAASVLATRRASKEWET